MNSSTPVLNFHTRKWVKPEDLNPNHTLFGGRLLQWIDEEAVIYAIVSWQLISGELRLPCAVRFVINLIISPS
jgi:hypothetical protein